jgi:hypothetical protein
LDIREKKLSEKTFRAGMANFCILGPNWTFNFAERSKHWMRYITEGIIEKICRVLVDTGDMTSLQSSGGNSTEYDVQGSVTRKRYGEVSHGCSCSKGILIWVWLKVSSNTLCKIYMLPKAPILEGLKHELQIL